MQMNADHCAVICRCVSRVVGRSPMASEGWFWRALASEGLFVCWRIFCCSAGSGALHGSPVLVETS